MTRVINKPDAILKALEPCSATTSAAPDANTPVTISEPRSTPPKILFMRENHET